LEAQQESPIARNMEVNISISSADIVVLSLCGFVMVILIIVILVIDKLEEIKNQNVKRI
jgi:hypothetical protein